MNKPSINGRKKGMKTSKKKVCKNVRIRKDKEVNAILIRDGILQYLHEHGKPPTDTELAKVLKLHRNTINKHIKEIKFESSESIYRTFTPDVIMSIINSCKKGSSASQKLYMQIFEKFSERLEHTGKDGESLVTGIKVEIVKK